MCSKSKFMTFYPTPQAHYPEVSRMLQMADRLVAYHFAADQIQMMNSDLQERWELLMSTLDDRLQLLSLSVSFHKKEEKVRGVAAALSTPRRSALLRQLSTSAQPAWLTI